MERRKFMRVNFSGDVYCKIWVVKEDDKCLPLLSDEKKFKKVEKKNISCGGVCIITEESISPQTIVFMNIKLPNLTSAVFVVGEVAWSKKRNSNFEIGIKFLKVADEDYFKISDFTIGKILGDIEE